MAFAFLKTRNNRKVTNDKEIPFSTILEVQLKIPYNTLLVPGIRWKETHVAIGLASLPAFLPLLHCMADKCFLDSSSKKAVHRRWHMVS